MFLGKLLIGEKYRKRKSLIISRYLFAKRCKMKWL